MNSLGGLGWWAPGKREAFHVSFRSPFPLLFSRRWSSHPAPSLMYLFVALNKQRDAQTPNKYLP